MKFDVLFVWVVIVSLFYSVIVVCGLKFVWVVMLLLIMLVLVLLVGL